MASRVKQSDPTRAIAYLRVSTDDQANGLEAQRAALTTWAAREGIAIAAWYTDAGVSGGAELSERPGLVAALSALREHGAGLLVVHRRDRLARDVGVALAIERAASDSGARVSSVEGAGNGNSAADQFLRTILDAAAAYERELIRARIRAALAVKKARGERVGMVPFGYSSDATGKLVPNPGEQRVLEQARSLRAEGLSLRAIVTALDVAGHVGRTGKPLALPQIARMLAPARAA